MDRGFREKSGVTRPCRPILGFFLWPVFDISCALWVCLGLFWAEFSAILTQTTAIKGFISILDCGDQSINGVTRPCRAISWPFFGAILGPILSHPVANYGYQGLHIEIRLWRSQQKWRHAFMQGYSCAF